MNTNTKETLGLVFLGATSAFGLHSAINPSLFTLRAFGQQNPVAVQSGLAIGLGSVLLLAAGIRFVYGKKADVPAVATALTGLGLYVLSQRALQAGARDGVQVNFGGVNA